MRLLQTLLFLAFTACLTAQPQLRFEPLSPTFAQPLGMVSNGAEAEADLLYIVERAGRILIYDRTTDAILDEPFLDIRDQVVTTGEGGLLGVAFHPDYPEVPRVFVQYTVGIPNNLTSIVSWFRVEQGIRPVLTGEVIVLAIAQPRDNHLAGDIAFGPDGYLYIPTGDSGGGGDPDNVSQDLGSLLGKMLRIDVDNPDVDRVLASPRDNPFVDQAGAQPEIWAYGLRNPYRISFDENGDLYIADVGQNAREEINRQAVSAGGGQNYGWDCREGDIAFPRAGQRSPVCPVGDVTDPLYDYTHDSNGGRASVTGGYVHRGPVEDLRGYYVFGDFVSGEFFLLDVSGGDAGAGVTATRQSDPAFGNSSISSFGVDADGNNYVANISTGRVYRITTERAVSNRDLPVTKGVRVFPNPARERLTVELGDRLTEPLRLELFDAQGRRVFLQQTDGVVSGRIAIDGLEVKTGVYQLVVTSSSRVWTARVVSRAPF